MEARRRILVFDRVSADGYFSGPDGGLGWTVPDDDVDKAGAEGIPGVDTILFGRRTYEMFAAFWPRVQGEPAAADPHDPRRRSPQLQAFARSLDESTKLVFSRTLKEVTWRGSRLLPELDPRAIAALKREPGKDIIVFGSGSIVSQLTEHGLVDQYELVVNPVLLGGGRPLVSGLPTSVRLALVEARPFPSGNVLLRYARAA
jgi:dihydrofolate reductase